MEKYTLYLVIVVLIALVYYLFNNKSNLKVYWFHRPGCPHCDNMEDEWAGVETKLQGSIETKRIDISDPKYAIIKKNFNIETVPQIIKIKSNGLRINYEGARKTKDILEWVYEDDQTI